MVTIVGVSRARTSGSAVTKKGKKAYRGNKKHWYIYYYDDDGKFKKRQISALQVPFYGSLIRRRKSYHCPKCGKRFRSLEDECPKCGTKSSRVERRALPPPVISPSQQAPTEARPSQ